VLDEVLHAIKDELLNLREVLKVVEGRGKTHLVLTGRFDTSGMSKLLKEVDLVTECKKIKHPFDLGKKAVKGLDY
jgi:cob(I)alamin adenosyltransferase